MRRIAESELILPALYLMYYSEGGKISTSELIVTLTSIYHPKGLDASILKNRKDSRFSQKVRNLKSHLTFERYGYAESTSDGFIITPLGRQFVEAKQDIIKYLFASNDMEFIDTSASCTEILKSHTNRKIIPLTETVQEGRSAVKQSLIYERSAQLRNAAREYFMRKDGLLYCDCCNYEYTHFHISPYDQGCIEIHHMKPLFQYEDEDINSTIEAALKNLIPVCPNCHRLIHKNKVGRDQINEFKSCCYHFNY